MKLRYLLVGYIAIMLCIFLAMHFSDGQTVKQRDMVYYNEQRFKITEELQRGVEPTEMEEKYECEILLLSDERYALRLQEALKKEALILDYFQGETLAGKIVWQENEKYYEQMEERLQTQTLFIWGLVFLCGCILLGVLYYRLVRPFQNLQRFAMQVAKGNLDFPLPMKKSNYFGAFTESFDLMREELKRAKESEYKANQSKKELMAELSHDIKTPIATIEATCEVLQVKEENSDTLKKVELIDSKAKMIHKLVDNLFHATLEELAVLKVEPMEESSLCVMDMFSELNYYGELVVTDKIPECLVMMDKLRLQQVIDNCFNNAWKYAGTAVEVSFKEQPEVIQIKIKDNGPGVSEEELPLILEKFYRGSNAKGKAGSGLGLYLAKTFMEQMQGAMEYYNEDGFVVELSLRKVGSFIPTDKN